MICVVRPVSVRELDLTSTQSSEASSALRGHCELHATQMQQQYLVPKAHKTSPDAIFRVSERKT